MNFVRFNKDGNIHYGVLSGDKITQLKGDIYSVWEKTDKVFHQQEVKLLAPCEPTKIVCVGTNYMSVVKEKSGEAPKEPVIFLKPPSTVIGSEEAIIVPEDVKTLNYEVELGVVIKKKAKNISPEEAKEYILGYTCANDITAKDFMEASKPWTKGKCYDTFLPLGPSIASNLDGDSLNIAMYHNKVKTQSENTSDMIFKIGDLVSYISKIMTLHPGDVISTGTPTGKGNLVKGDVIEAYVEGVGTLTNFVK